MPTRPSSQCNRGPRIFRTGQPVTGGCKVLEDPNRRGDEVVLFWQAELLTDLVRLTLAPANANSQLRFEPRRWAGQQATLTTNEGLHLILRVRRNTQYRLLLPGPDPPPDGSLLAIVIEPNRFWHSRLAAAERFLALTAHPPPPFRSPRLPLISSEEIAHRTYVLWAIDLEQAGASEHWIGALLFGTRVSSAVWSNHADRSELRRLLRAGRSFVSGGYRELLHVRPPR
jgi:hypothetical protein